MLPMLLDCRVQGEKRPHSFWFPLGLIYLLFVPVLILGAVAYFILLLIPGTARQARSYFPLINALPSLLSAAIGTELAFRSKDKDIEIHII